MGVIVAIGGYSEPTEVFNKLIIEYSNKVFSKILYIPAASNNEEKSYEKFLTEFKNYKCLIEPLYLKKQKNLREYILSFDIIYVGGGNTKKMLEEFYRYKVDKILQEAFNNKIVLAGVSAGAIMWFRYCYTDANTYKYRGEVYNYSLIKGLDFIPYACSPHYDIDSHESFDDDVIGTGIALENNTAFILNDDYFMIKCLKKNRAYKVSREDLSLIPCDTWIKVGD